MFVLMVNIRFQCLKISTALLSFLNFGQKKAYATYTKTLTARQNRVRRSHTKKGLVLFGFLHQKFAGIGGKMDPNETLFQNPAN